MNTLDLAQPSNIGSLQLCARVWRTAHFPAGILYNEYRWIERPLNEREDKALVNERWVPINR